MKRCAFAVLCSAALLAGQQPEDRFLAAQQHYRAGRYEAAFADFAAELGARGAVAPAVLRFDTALAALRVLRTADAEQAIAPLATSDRPEERADAEFVLAMVAHQRAERAALAAQLPDAEPMAWPSAVQSMERAFAGFCAADALREGWAEARRNAERAQRRLAELQRLRDASKPPAAKSAATPEPQPLPQPTRTPVPEPAEPEVAVAPLPPDEQARLLDRLQRQERAKRTLRQAQQRASVVAGERDW